MRACAGYIHTLAQRADWHIFHHRGDTAAVLQHIHRIIVPLQLRHHILALLAGLRGAFYLRRVQLHPHITSGNAGRVHKQL